MLLEEIIFERSRASLYHFTTLENSYNILKSNTIGKEDSRSGNVFFTRNFKYNIFDVRYEDDGWQPPVVRFEVDQDKLKTRHSIMPTKNVLIYQNDEILDEFEETAIGPIRNFNNYLIEITITDIENFEYYIDYYYMEISTNIEESLMNTNFSKPVIGDYPEYEVYNFLVYCKNLFEHPKMNGNNAKKLWDLFDVYKNIFMT